MPRAADLRSSSCRPLKVTPAALNSKGILAVVWWIVGAMCFAIGRAIPLLLRLFVAVVAFVMVYFERALVVVCGGTASVQEKWSKCRARPSLPLVWSVVVRCVRPYATDAAQRPRASATAPLHVAHRTPTGAPYRAFASFVGTGLIFM